MSSEAKAKLGIYGEDHTASAWRSVISGANEAAEKVKGLWEAAFVGISVAAIAELGKHALEVGDQLEKARIKAGVSGQAISELAYAAKLADVDVESLSTGIKKMQVALSEAATGGKEPKLALDALGLSVKQLQGLQPDKQFEIIADRISQLKDPADRARAAVILFGKAGTDLLPIFSEGAEGIRKAREEAQKLGASFNDEQLKNLSEADDAIKRLKATFEALATSIAAKAAPAVTGFFNGITAWLGDDEVAKIKARIDTLQVKQGELLHTPGQQKDFADEIRRLEAQLTVLESIKANNPNPIRPLSFEPSDAEPGGIAHGFAAADAAQKQAEEIAKAQKEIDSKTGEIFESTNDEIERVFKKGYDEDKHNMDERVKDILKAHNEEVTAEYDIQRMREEGSRDYIEYIDTWRESMKNAWEDFVQHGEFSIRKIGQFILAELSQKEIFKAIDVIGDYLQETIRIKSAASGGNGFWGVLGGIVGAFTGGADASAVSSTGAGYGAMADSEIASSFPGFATGGDFDVGGSGGTDSQLVAFRATPGERVSVTRPGQSSGGVTINHSPTYNINAPNGDQQLRNALPSLLQQTAEKSKRDLLDAFRRSGFAAPRTAS